jgi:hypothetical protein
VSEGRSSLRGSHALAVVLAVTLAVTGCSPVASPTPVEPARSPAPPASAPAPEETSDIGLGGPPSPPAVPVDEAPEDPIAAAVLAGELETGQALLYEAYAAIHPALVPEAYRPATSPALAGDASVALAGLEMHLDELSGDLREEAEALFRRPSQGGSFWMPALERTVDDTTGPGDARLAAIVPGSEDEAGFVWNVVDTAHIRVWYWTLAEGWEEDPSDSERTAMLARYRALSAGARSLAERVAAEIDRSRMWELEKAAMLGREPCSDALLEENGGDGRLDLYLVPGDVAVPREGGKQLEKDAVLGVAIPFESGQACKRAPILLVRQTLDWRKMKSVVAHEVFHAFSYAYGSLLRSVKLPDGKVVHQDFQYVFDYTWLLESTATWAMDLVYPRDNVEHPFVYCWARPRAETNGPLDANMCAYSNYQWWFYLTRLAGRPATTVGDVHAAAERKVPLDVVGALPGWADRFREYNLWNWNRSPVEKYRDPGDGSSGTGVVTEVRQTTTPVAISIPTSPVTIPISLDHTSGAYWELTPDHGAGRIGRLDLDLSGLTGKPGAGLQAIVTIGDPERPRRQYTEDWSKLSEKRLCLDDPDEALTKVVLVASNSSVTRGNVLTGAVQVEAPEAGCSAYRVAITVTSTSVLHAGSWTLRGTLDPYDPEATYDADQPIDQLVGEGTWEGSAVNPFTGRYCDGGQTTGTGSGRVWLTGSIVDGGPPGAEWDGPSLLFGAFPVGDEIEAADGRPFPPFIDLFALYAPADGGGWRQSWTKMQEAECGEPWTSTIEVEARKGG